MAGDNPFPGVQRFPRLLLGKHVAELGQKLWEQPVFSVGEENGATQFIFSVPVQSKFKQLSPKDYERLFQLKNTSWSDALKRSYREAHSGKTKPVKDLIDTVLYKLFSEALLLLETDTERLSGDYTDFKKEQVVNFRAAAPRVPGRRANPGKEERAIRLANRFEVLSTRIQELREFVDGLKQNGICDEDGLRAKVTESFTDEWIPFVTTGSAFAGLPSDSYQDSTEISSTLGGEWTPWQLTVGVIRCEEKVLTNKSLKARTIYRIILHGRKLLGNESSAGRKE